MPAAPCPENTSAFLGGHLPELLATFRYGCPMLLAVAIDMQFGLKPACIVERTSLDEGNARHHGGVSENGRTALGTEVSINCLATIPRVMKRLKLPLERHWRFWDADEN